jgi:heme/copper-type cytochrome/quinol oxidase subunit 2
MKSEIDEKENQKSLASSSFHFFLAATIIIVSLALFFFLVQFVVNMNDSKKNQMLTVFK